MATTHRCVDVFGGTVPCAPWVPAADAKHLCDRMEHTDGIHECACGAVSS